MVSRMTYAACVARAEGRVIGTGGTHGTAMVDLLAPDSTSPTPRQRSNEVM